MCPWYSTKTLNSQCFHLQSHMELTTFPACHCYSAGKHWNRKGSGTNTLCLPSDPTWSRHKDGDNEFFRGHIYGAELDVEDNHDIFGGSSLVHQQDMPCALCHSTRSSTIMIPGRNDCYSGWTLEYRGYLVAGRDSQEAYDHICLDGSPEFVPHGGGNDNQHIFYVIDGKCGSLPCPPYIDGRELACVVCSK